MKTLLARLIACALLINSCSIYAIDNDHFYRASFLWPEPRFAHKTLTTFDIQAGGGSTCQGRNGCGAKTGILNIYGLYNMHLVGAGVPDKDPTNPVDLALIMLEQLPSRGTFGELCFNGKFNIAEGTFSFLYNPTDNFYLQLYFPVRSLKISDIGYTDLSPNDEQFPNINTPQWQTFLHLFDATLAQYDLNIGFTNDRGIGDTTLLAGWTYSFQDTKEIDYVDTSLAFGVLIPTGKVSDPNFVFDLPLGYNGHVGFPIFFSLAIGAYEWVTLGAHIGIIPFLSKLHVVRMKTDLAQSGMIKLAGGCACIEPGALWHAAAYIKADHLIRGLSFILGYEFARKNNDQVSPENLDVFDFSIVNSDPQFHSWNMSTINIAVEYDFAKDGWHVGPRIGGFYNHPAGGKRIFNTGIGGGGFGLDIAWDF